MRIYQDEALVQQNNAEEEKRRVLNSELTSYWATHQRPEDSRDADLKFGLKGAFKIAIPENELGPASMQIFKVGQLWQSRGFVSFKDREGGPANG